MLPVFLKATYNVLPKQHLELKRNWEVCESKVDIPRGVKSIGITSFELSYRVRRGPGFMAGVFYRGV